MVGIRTKFWESPEFEQFIVYIKATAAWAKAIADEGGRGKQHAAISPPATGEAP